MGSDDYRELLEVFNDENVNKDSVSDTLNIHIINDSWDTHYYEISAIMLITRIMPLVSMIILVLLEENMLSLILNLISSFIVVVYEFL
jgi:hypothetical protein